MSLGGKSLNKSLRRLAVIPARGSSKRLPRKNILPLGGKPLLCWTLDAAIESCLFDTIIVSTEDEEIAKVARLSGEDIPLIRPVTLAKDNISSDQVALHALEQLEMQGKQFDTLCLMLPTCPFRSAEDVCQAHELFEDRSHNNLMSVSLFEHQPFWALGLCEEELTPHFPEPFKKRRQDLPAAYRPNGAIHILDVAWFKRVRSYGEGPILGYVMPAERSVDIDTEADLRMAEFVLSERHCGADKN